VIEKRGTNVNPDEAAFTLAAIGFFADSENFYLAIDMFNSNSILRKGLVKSFLLLGQRILFRSLERNDRVYQIFIYPLISAVQQS